MAPRGTNRARLLLVSLLVTSLLLITLDLRGANVVAAVRSATQTVLSPSKALEVQSSLQLEISLATYLTSEILGKESKN